MGNHQRQLVLNLLAYVTQRDVSAQEACTAAGIDWQLLMTRESMTFTDDQLSKLWLETARLCRDPWLGLHFGESLQLVALGVVGEIIRSSQTVGEALNSAVALTHLVTSQVRLEITHTDTSFRLHVVPTQAAPAAYPFFLRQTIDWLMAFALHELDGLLLEKIRPRAVRLGYEVTNLPEYERVFRCPITQQPGEYCMVFSRAYWQVPVLTANHELQQLLLQKVAAQRTGNGNRHSLQERIHEYLLSNAYLGVVSLNQLSANFHLSPRTLQRKLKEEGVSYQAIADRVRKSLSLHYLRAGDHPLKEIAFMLGYNETSAFNRAFKRWTGYSPASYQKQTQSPVAIHPVNP